MEATKAAFLIGLAMFIVGLVVLVLAGKWEETEPGHYVLRGSSAILVLVPVLGVVLMIAGAVYHFVWKR
jgi:hypothetical protein